MLILKQPLQCKTLSPLSTVSDSFEEKLFGNYQFMSAHIRKEELLYLISMPPEIYIGGEGMTSILTENTVKNSQTINIEVMNSLLNRILLCQDGHFTYQDSVYVTTILQKLGIQDVKSFMKQVSELKEETRQVHKLTALYENHRERLQQLFTLLQAGGKAEKEEQKEEGQQMAEYHLHHSIFQRLKTEEVYQTVANYAGNQASEEYEVTNQELLTAEQRKLAQEITLNRIRNQVTNQQMPLLFCHMNRYEMETQEDTQITESSMLSQLNAAVLLNLVDNIYTARTEKWVKGPENSFRLVQALYQAGENTMKRFESWHREAVIRNQDTENYVTELNQAYHSEIKMISRLFGEGKTVRADHYSESGQRFYQTETPVSTGDQYDFSSLMENHTENSTLNLQYVDGRQIEEWDEETKAEYYQNIRQNLDKINEQNLVMREKLMQLEKTTPVYRNITVDREKARRDSLRALENPGEVLLEYMQETTHEERIENHAREQIFQLFSRETRAIYEQLLPKQEAARPEHVTEQLIPGSEEQIRQEIEEARREEQSREAERTLPLEEKDKDTEISAKNLYQILRHIEKNLIPVKQEGAEQGQNVASRILHTEELRQKHSEIRSRIERNELPVQIEKREKELLLYYLELGTEERALLPEPVTAEIEERLRRLWEKDSEKVIESTETTIKEPGTWERIWQELETERQTVKIQRKEQSLEKLPFFHEKQEETELPGETGLIHRSLKELTEKQETVRKAEHTNQTEKAELTYLTEKVSSLERERLNEIKKEYGLPIRIEKKEKELLREYLMQKPDREEELPERIVKKIRRKLEKIREKILGTEENEEIKKSFLYAEEKEQPDREEIYQYLELADSDTIRLLARVLERRQGKEIEKHELLAENPLRIVQEIYQRQERQLVDIRKQTSQSSIRQLELLYNEKEEQEAAQELLEYRLERWLEPKEQVQVLYGSKERQTIKNTELYHKQTETDLEELYQELAERERVHQSVQEFSENTKEESYQINRQYKESTREITVENTEDITNLIKQGVRKQIGMISEQVYSRLEKKLANERKRRGF